jgi:hypothetical protein
VQGIRSGLLHNINDHPSGFSHFPWLRDDLRHAIRTNDDFIASQNAFRVGENHGGTATARLWTFLDVEGVEPTNNASERALRPVVIWRKLSFGTQSAAGSRFVESILSIVEKCRQQQRGVFAYLTAAIQARRNGTSTRLPLSGV